MGLGSWLKNLFQKDDEEVEVVCPKCGCKDFSTFTYLANFVEVMREVEPARYVTSGITKSTPSILSSGNSNPQSTKIISSSYSNTVVN